MIDPLACGEVRSADGTAIGTSGSEPAQRMAARVGGGALMAASRVIVS